ncbi:tyrosine-type recombinase/integrase [Egibacter rhizosphaerae]|uniref:tyrosine-type recombinase/integrase n=1 Tax=Egibacter rhizosphaerae TaxID=1670831 RepID=UPI00197AB65F
MLGYANERTRNAYQADLRDWSAWCRTHEVDPLGGATRAHVNIYSRWLEGQGRSRATIARRLATLSSYYRYCVIEGHLERNPVEHVRRPKIDDASHTKGLDTRDAIALLDAAEDASARDHALACLLLLNGLRVGEACGLDIQDVGEQRGHRTITIRRKGGKRVTRALAPRAAGAVHETVGDREAGPVLCDLDGARLDRHDATRVVRRLAREVLPRARADRITPHSLRHSAATIALDAGVPLHRVQDLLGHADPRTTRRYDRARDSLDSDATYALAGHLAR